MSATLFAFLVVMCATPASCQFDEERGGGLPHCECDVYHNGAYQWMSRMCMRRWNDLTICYPTHLSGDDHPGTWVNGIYYNNWCEEYVPQRMCSPWTPPESTADSGPPATGSGLFWREEHHSCGVCNLDHHWDCPEELCNAATAPGLAWHECDNNCVICNATQHWECPEELCNAATGPGLVWREEHHSCGVCNATHHWDCPEELCNAATGPGLFWHEEMHHCGLCNAEHHWDCPKELCV